MSLNISKIRNGYNGSILASYLVKMKLNINKVKSGGSCGMVQEPYSLSKLHNILEFYIIFTSHLNDNV